jgi:hypothetical protein
MKILLRLLTLAFSAIALTARAQGTAFTYQGRLNDGANPAGGNYDLRFAIYDSTNSPGTIIAGPLTNSATGVTNGLFTVILDFGTNVFTGPGRWLEIGVRKNGPGAFTPLNPRQKLTATPYAIMAGSVASGGLLAGTYGSAVTFNNAANSFNGVHTGSGAGLTSLNATQLTSGTVPDARLAANVARTNQVWLLDGNAGTTAGTHFLGTTDDEPLEFKVNGQRGLRIEPNTSGAPNIIGGSSRNVADAGVIGAFIGGGGAVSFSGTARTNRIASSFSMIGGGFDNLINTNARAATIGGGQDNMIQSGVNSTIGGGHENVIQSASTATIAGGDGNTMTNATWSFIGGGFDNLLEGTSSGIASGLFNNILSQSSGFIGGGAVNRIGGTTHGGGSTGVSNVHNAIVGGVLNWIAEGAAASFIGGGRNNFISNGVSFATVPGGQDNRAGGDYSFAAGRRAKADHDGAFVWADSQNADFRSTATNQFLIRASGGVGIGTTNPATALDVNGTVTAIQFLAESGSELAASYTFQGDSNTGLFQPAANTLALATAGTERMRIESSGNVGIRTNNPATALHVNGTARVEGHTTIGALFALSRVTVVPTSNSTLTPTTSYLLLNPASSVTLSIATAIANGSAIGDVLILEGTDDFQTVTINDAANTNLAAASRTLGNDDTLMLIWNGASWMEISFSNN